MGLILKILRSVIYMFLIFIFVGFSYKGLDLFCYWILKGIGSFQNSMNVILFWFLFFIIGISIFSILWFVFKAIVILINSSIAKICPYPSLGESFVSINVLLSLGYYIYSVWWLNYDTSSFFGIIVCIVATFMGITLGKIITENTKSIFLHRKFKDFTYRNVYDNIIEEDIYEKDKF